MTTQDDLDPSPSQLAELSALADGSLDPGRRQAVQDRIARSVQLRDLYERECAAVEVLQRAATEPAPARLRMRLEAERAKQATGWGGWRPAYGAAAGALACVVAALVLLLPGGTPGSPSVSQAAQLALRGASGPPPAADPSEPRMKLAQQVQGLYFPNWSHTLGWRPAGARSDRLGGRQAVTVYYQRQGMSVAYTIVAAPTLARPSSPTTHLGRFVLQTFNLRGRSVVTWRRAGHTCVISASEVPMRVLEQLADWPTTRISD